MTLADEDAYSIIDADIIEVINDVDVDDVFLSVHYVLCDLRRLSSVLRRGCVTFGEVV